MTQEYFAEPCPCCKSEVIVKQKEEFFFGRITMKLWKVICTGCSLGASNTSLEALMQDWNTRV